MENRSLGIIGGGQLGRMLAIAASRLGFKTIVLDPDAACPAAQLCSGQIVADYADERALDLLAQRTHIITYEFENVPVASAHFLAKRTTIFPPARALEISQDRLMEKQFFDQYAIPTPPYWCVDNEEDLHAALKASGGTGILKTRQLGYDGKGQVRFDGSLEQFPKSGNRFSDKNCDENNKKEHSTDTLAQVKNALITISHAPAILEAIIAFTCEISVIAARSQTGAVVFFDIPENIHQGGILRRSHLPASIDETTAEQARDYTRRLLEALDYVGVIALEFFVTKQGELIANEFAPRVHNSGHWSEAVCCVSQFDQHIRAIGGLPLVKPLRHSDCVMENLIGDDVDRLPELLAQDNILIHLYGKDMVREGRKMGHFTRIFD